MHNEDKKGVILSGMRPTGRLHLGNYLGALENWVAMQEEYSCIYTVVDIHALTTVGSPQDIADIQPNIYEMVLDSLAAGVDPQKSTLNLSKTRMLIFFFEKASLIFGPDINLPFLL